MDKDKQDMTTACRRTDRISSFIVMDVLEKAQQLEREGRRIIHLEIGEPDFPTPECICEAAREAMCAGKTHYTHSLGIPELRHAIAGYYMERYGVSVEPERILVTSGTSPALFMIFAALLEAGDEIIMSDPHYPCYPNFAYFLGAQPVFVPVREEDAFQIQPGDVKALISPRTRAVIINSPANPTGALLSDETMEGLSKLDLPIISDEIYHGLVYGRKERSILEFMDNAFVLNGFSKRYAMTGWRLGYLIAPEQFMRPIQKIQQNLMISAGSLSQWAGLAALSSAGDDVKRMKAVYDERRRYLLGRLRTMGFGIPYEPAGAFYILANASHLSSDSYALAFELLEHAGVAVTPGIDFGAGAEGYLRFSYANSIEQIREGCDRLKHYLATR
jgi:(5-formylfuran-3-yl)methyl phosphate transaminase